MGKTVECPKCGGTAGEYAPATSTWTCAVAGCSASLCVDPRMVGTGPEPPRWWRISSHDLGFSAPVQCDAGHMQAQFQTEAQAWEHLEREADEAIARERAHADEVQRECAARIEEAEGRYRQALKSWSRAYHGLRKATGHG